MYNLFFDNVIFSLQKAGGISVVWKELLSSIIADEECCVNFIEYEDANSNIFRKTLDIPSSNVIVANDKFLKLSRYLNPYIGSESPFIFHSSYFRTSNNKNAINITTVHDFTYEYFMSGLRRKVHSWQKFRAIRNSDVIVCISENTKKDVLKFLPEIPENKIRVIYNGVSDDYKIISTSKYSELGDFVLFVGSRQPYKNFYFTVEALKRSHFKLVIVGSPLSHSEQTFIENALGQNMYVMMPFLSNEELNELYNAAYCFVYPSLYEGFGIPILEAQRAGCPVIAFSGSSVLEVIGETPLLLNSVSDTEFLNKLDLLKSSTLKKEIIEAGLENSSRFSWEKMGKEYINLYKSIWK